MPGWLLAVQVEKKHSLLLSLLGKAGSEIVGTLVDECVFNRSWFSAWFNSHAMRPPVHFLMPLEKLVVTQVASLFIEKQPGWLGIMPFSCPSTLLYLKLCVLIAFRTSFRGNNAPLILPKANLADIAPTSHWMHIVHSKKCGCGYYYCFLFAVSNFCAFDYFLGACHSIAIFESLLSPLFSQHILYII